MSNYTKIVIRLLAAMAIVGSLGACADRGAKNPQDALTASVNASSVDESFVRERSVVYVLYLLLRTTISCLVFRAIK